MSPVTDAASIMRTRLARLQLTFSGILLFVAGCSLFGQGQEAGIQFTVDPEVLASNGNTFTITVEDGSSVRRITREDFETTGGSSLRTDRFETAAAGSLRVSFTVANPDEERITEGDVALDLRETWYWSFVLFADSASADPLRGCLGCFGYRSFPINKAALEQEYPSSPDSVYVVWSGNRIDNPVTY